MKKINYLLFFVLIGSISFMASCGSDDDPTPPTVTILTTSAPDGYIAGKTVTYSILLSSNADLKTFSASSGAVNGAAGSGVVSTDPTDKFEAGEFSRKVTKITINYAFVIPAVAEGTAITVQFTVTDKDATATKSAEQFEVVLPTNPGTAMTDENMDGIIYHILGSNQGAWDLVANKGRSEKEDNADKDMINETSGVKGTFLKEWSAGNATTFVLADLDYATVTDLMASTAFASKTATKNVKDVAKDQIYIAKLRGGDDYAVIKILDVVETDNDNNDNIKFSYKKKPATSTKSTGPQKLVYY